MEIALFVIALALAGLAVTLGLLLVRTRERAAGALTRLGESEAQATAAQARLDAAIEGRMLADRQLAAVQQRLSDLEKLLNEAEGLRHEMTNAAKAAALESMQVLSSKLIDDHKRETAEAKKDSEERVRQTSEQLVKQVDDIAKAVAALNGQVQEKGRVLDTVWRSLTSPGGSGQIAEIGLANTLKGFGLELGRDYQLQATTADALTGERLRPDALVFLPGNSAVVIDCKASKFLLEIAEAEGGADEAQAYANLARTMNLHLKALADKNYRGAVQAAWRAAGRGGEVARVLSIMYLPNEAALEKLIRADAGFRAKAHEAEIIPAGPAGLHSVLTVAAAEITQQRQVENQQRILEAAQALLEGIGVALGHAGTVGRSMRAAAEAWEKMTKSVNQRLLPRAKRLVALGVPPGKSLPGSLPNYTVVIQEPDQLIEGEAAEVADEPPAPRLLAE